MRFNPNDCKIASDVNSRGGLHVPKGTSSVKVSRDDNRVSEGGLHVIRRTSSVKVRLLNLH